MQVTSNMLQMNIHPVRMALELKKTSTMLDNLSKVVLILGLMSDRQFRDRKDVNEVLSLKFHMIHYILKDLLKQKEKYKNKSNFVDLWIKSMLVGRDLDGFPVFQEDFLRQGIKEFPYKESTLFQALVITKFNALMTHFSDFTVISKFWHFFFRLPTSPKVKVTAIQA